MLKKKTSTLMKENSTKATELSGLQKVYGLIVMENDILSSVQKDGMEIYHSYLEGYAKRWYGNISFILERI